MGCPSEVQIGNNLVFAIATHDPDTAILSDASPAPTYEVFEEDGTTVLLSGSMTKRKAGNTGRYVGTIACTAANGFENGKCYCIEIAATVDGDTGGITFVFTAYTTVATVRNLSTEISNFAVDD
jgi:hypothetical protein